MWPEGELRRHPPYDAVMLNALRGGPEDKSESELEAADMDMSIVQKELED